MPFSLTYKRRIMRTITSAEITEAVTNLCIQANMRLPEELEALIKSSPESEKDERAKAILSDIAENLNAASELQIPICQDTGMAVVFAEVGQNIHIEGSFEAAVNQGVREGYAEGFLRASIVADPLHRINTGDNTPAVIHTRLVEGDKLQLTVAPKGFGSENMSKIRMFTPSAAEEDIIAFITESVISAGSNPCPPIVLGIGIGGDFEMCALLAKKALCRNISEPNRDDYYAELERKILAAVNQTNIGPQGFGGETTALAVLIEAFPTHIAGLPVAVNFGCHVTRHASIIL